jgi:hypothetical protein
MHAILNAQVFLDSLIQEIRGSNNLEGELSEYRKASAAEVFILLAGNGGLRLEVEPYYSVKNVIGYGLPQDNITRLNTRFLNQYSAHNPVHIMLVGSNLLHEKGHDKGFEHDFWDTPRRKNSLCYVLNRAYEKAYCTVNKIEPVVYVPRRPWWKFW